jgi:tetratricopeptide (TPR) repeat protein
MSGSFEEIARDAERRISEQDYEGAWWALEKIQADCQDEPEFWSLLGRAYLCGDRPYDAEEPLARAQALAPTFDNQFNLAECAFVRGDYPLAAGEFRKALGLAPDNPDYRGITAFKVIVSEELSGESGKPAGNLEAELIPAGRLYLEIFRRLMASESASALTFLGLPEATDAGCAPYLDTLLTADLISIQKPESGG